MAPTPVCKYYLKGESRYGGEYARASFRGHSEGVYKSN